MEPVAVGDVALGDGHEAGEPRLGGQQVVERRVEAAGAFGVRQPDSRWRRSGAGGRTGSRSACRRRKPARARRAPRARAAAPARGPSVASAAARARAQATPSPGRLGAAERLGEVRPQAGREASRLSSASSTPIQARQQRGHGATARRRPRRAPPRSASREATRRGDGGGVGAGRPGAAPATAAIAGELPQALGQRDQRPGEVAAVHGGDVPGRQRRQGAGVVPVQEMPLVALQPLHRGHQRARAAPAARRCGCSRGRGRPASTAGPSRCWWARSGAPRRASGVSWKLSGGRPWSAAPMKVSK